MRRLRLAILLGFACFVGTDSAAFVPLRTLSPVTCLGFAPEVSQGTHFRAALGGDEEHCFKLELKKGDALHAIVWQQGVDVKLSLKDPDGAEILSVDSPNAYGDFEALYVLSERSGAHLLRIVNQKENRGGIFELRIAKLQPADEGDRQRAEAQRAMRKEASIEELGRAAELWREIGDPYQEALALLALGRKDGAGGQWLVAKGHLRSALELIRGQEHEEVEVVLWNELARANHNLSELQQATASARIALQLANAIGHTRGRMTALGNLGLYKMERSDFADAIELLDEALSVERTVDAPRDRAIFLHNLGQVYNWLGRFKEARDRLEEALGLLRAVGTPSEIVKTLMVLGRVDYFEARYDVATQHYQEALDLDRTRGGQVEEAAILDRLGTLHRKVGRYDLAETHYRAALEKLPEALEATQSAEILANLGSLFIAMGQPRRALELLEKARLEFLSRDTPSTEAHVLVELAGALYQNGETRRALARLEEALAFVEQLRLSSADYSLRESLLASRRDYYEAAIALLMQLDADQPRAGHAARAFEISEQARSRSLLEMLHEQRAAIRATADPQWRARQGEVAKQLESPELGAGPALSPDQLEHEKRRLGRAFEEAEARFRNSSPAFRNEAVPEPLGAQQIQALLDDDTVLLAYTLSHEQSFLWLVTRRSIHGFRLPARGQIEPLARRYHVLLMQTSNDPVRERLLAEEGKKLAHELLGPVAGLLGDHRLVFLLDGELHSIPFGALPDPDFVAAPQPVPLIDHHEIDYLPSASVLPVLRSRLAEPTAANGTVAIFADAAYRRDDRDVQTPPQAASPPFGALGFSPLPGSGREADAILQLADPLGSLDVRGFEATRERFLATDFSHYRIVHLAVHGVLEENPWFSRIVLAQVDARGQPRDGALMLADIHQLDIPADLVVLSACDTARGNEVRGEGIVGLPRGFLYAGAARVVASLWKVDDAATAELMQRFYRAMFERDLEPAAALRAAQLELRRQPGWAPPRFWAGFVLQGAW